MSFHQHSISLVWYWTWNDTEFVRVIRRQAVTRYWLSTIVDGWMEMVGGAEGTLLAGAVARPALILCWYYSTVLYK